MKKFLFLSFVLVACKSSNQPLTQTDKAVQLGCEQDFSHCINQCHHVSSSNGEDYDCMNVCKETAKKCGK